MQFDFAHAAAATVLVLIALWALEKMGIRHSAKESGKQWDWQIFLVVFAVVSLLNLLWPYS